jgi:hypothetical protein
MSEKPISPLRQRFRANRVSLRLGDIQMTGFERIALTVGKLVDCRR